MNILQLHIFILSYFCHNEIIKESNVFAIVQQYLGIMQVNQLQGVDSRDREARSPMQEESTFCSRFIPLLFLGLLSLIFYCYIQSQQLLTQINQVQGNINSYLPLYSGQIHYSRIVPEYWQHRISMIKGMGFNSISVYVMWNYHQVEKGIFNFESPEKNLAHFLELAKKLDMKVVLRPGPYVCAEWDFGGLPARLLGIQKMDIRQHNDLYEDQVKIFFKKLSQIIRPFLSQNGGPIIMLQIQNELGSFNSDSQHTQALIKIWKDLDITSEFYIEDAPWFWQKHYWDGAHIGLSEGGTIREWTDIQISKKRSKKSLIFGGQIYSGWLTHWGQTLNGRDHDQFKEHFTNILRANRSVSLYVAHGGTNFGLTAGANGFPKIDYMPHITSYDYDAPITERGTPRDKYHTIREVVQKYNRRPLPPIPSPLPIISIPPIEMKTKTFLFANLPKKTLQNADLTYFQSDLLKMYNQGFVLYETIIRGAGSHLFNVTFRDFALVYVNDVFQSSLSRQKIAYQFLPIKCPTAECNVKILVQAMGHINYGKMQKYDRKGLVKFEEIKSPEDKTILNDKFKWNIYKIPINDRMEFWNSSPSSISLPIMRYGSFKLEKAADTYFDLSKYGKGYVWINGFLLGRYWKKGPQQRLYCPGPWLKAGDQPNNIKILELLDEQHHEISGHMTPFDE